MDLRRLVVASLVVGVVANVFDALFHGMVMGSYYQTLPFMRQDTPMGLMVFGDFVFSLVFVVVYDRLYAAGDRRVGRGIYYGFWAGLLLNFPANIFMHLMIKGFPYGLSWIFTIVGLIQMTLLGAVAGALYAKKAPSATRVAVG